MAVLLLFLLGLFSAECAVVWVHSTTNCSDNVQPYEITLNQCGTYNGYNLKVACAQDGSWSGMAYLDAACQQPVLPASGHNASECVAVSSVGVRLNCSAFLNDSSSSSSDVSSTSSSDSSSNISSPNSSSSSNSSSSNSSSSNSSSSNSSSSNSSSSNSSSSNSSSSNSSSSNSSSSNSSSSNSSSSNSSSSSSSSASSSSSSSNGTDNFKPGSDLTIFLCIGSGTGCKVCGGTQAPIVFNISFGNNQCFPFSSQALKAAIPATYLPLLPPSFFASSAEASCTKAASSFNYYTEGSCSNSSLNQSITIPANGCAPLSFAAFPLSLSATASCKNPLDGGKGNLGTPSATPSLFAFVSMLLTTVVLRNALK